MPTIDRDKVASIGSLHWGPKVSVHMKHLHRRLEWYVAMFLSMYFYQMDTNLC